MLKEIQSRIGQSRSLRITIYSVLGTVLSIILLTQVVARFLIWPQLEVRKTQIEQVLTGVLGLDVKIGEIHADWQNLRPSFEIKNITFKKDPKGDDSFSNQVLEVPKVSGILAWSSVWSLSPRFHDLLTENIRLTAYRDQQGLWAFAGIPISNTGGDHNTLVWILNERNLSAKNLHITVKDDLDGSSFNTFTVENFSLKNQMSNHVIQLNAFVKPTQGILNFSGDFNHKPFSDVSNWQNWQGSFVGEIQNINAANLLKITKLPIKSGSGQIEFKGQINLNHGVFQDSTAYLSANEINVIWANDQPDLHLNKLQIDVNQYAKDKTQIIDFKNFNWQFQDNKQKTHSINDLSLLVKPNQANDAISKIELNAPSIPLTELALLAQSIPLPTKIYKPLRQAQPEGSLEKFHVIWHKENLESSFLAPKKIYDEFEIQGLLKNIGWRSVGESIPGIKGINGEIESSLSKGFLQINSPELSMESAHYFHQKSITLPNTSGKVQWHKKDDQWLIDFDQLQIKDGNTEIQARGSYLTESKTKPDRLELDLQLVKMEANQLLNSIPKTIAPNAMEYLRSTISGGIITNSSLKIHGPTNEIPFTKGSKNQLQLDTNIKDAIYRPVAANQNIKGEWQSLEKVNARIQMDNNLLHVDAPSGKFKNVMVKDITADMDITKEPNTLEVKGKAGGSLFDFLTYLVATPIGNKWQPELKKISTIGNAQLDLKLTHQFGSKENTKVLAKVNLEKNQIRWGNNIPGNINKGFLLVDERGLQKADINGDWMGGPISIKNNITNPDQIDIHADIDGALLMDLFATGQEFNQDFNKNILTGKLGLHGNILRQNNDSVLNLILDLKSTHINLPKPLMKPAGENLLGTLKLNINSSVTNPTTDWQLKLGDMIQSSGQLSQQKLDKATVVIGNAQPPSLTKGLHVAFDVHTIQLDQWINLINEFHKVNPNYSERFVNKNSNQSTTNLPITISGKSSHLLFIDREFNNILVNMKEDNRIWDGTIRANNIDGKFNWQSKNSELPFGAISANFNKLYIPTSSTTTDSQNQSRSSIKFLPSMNISIADFQLGKMQLGAVQLQANATPLEWKLNHISSKTKFGEMNVKGNWELPSGNLMGKTAININLQTTDAGDLLTSLGVKENVIDRGKGTIQGNLNWQGSPIDFNTLSLVGNIQLEIKNGTILQVDPGAAKLLGILSLQSLFKFSTLNFDGSLGETLKSGTAFDEVTATATIRRGNIRTNDFEMTSTLARITSRGIINLNRETQDLRVTIYPRINFGSASLAAFYFATPIIGITTMIGQYLFSAGINKAFQSDLLIQGDWKNPEVIPLDQNGKPVDPEILKNIRRKSLLNESIKQPSEKKLPPPINPSPNTIP